MIAILKLFLFSPEDSAYLLIRKIKSWYFKIFLTVRVNSHKKFVSCNICNNSYKKFMSDKWHKDIICPNCFSDVRHRLLLMAIEKYNLIAYEKKNKILHFAPEKILAGVLQDRNLNGGYLTADIQPGFDIQIDICNMTAIENNSISHLIAIDVLEHVFSLKNCLKEINRVIKNDGIAILSFPKIETVDKTIDNINEFLTKSQRKKKFGQIDHNRLIGSDIDEIFKSHQFKIEKYDSKSFDDLEVKTNVLIPPIKSTKKFATNSRTIYVLKKINF